MAAEKTIWTIGHSTRDWEDFTTILKAFGIDLLVDVRTFPGSRRYPQFNQDGGPVPPGFGLLGLSGTPALRAFGLTMLIGTALVWLLVGYVTLAVVEGVVDLSRRATGRPSRLVDEKPETTERSSKP